MDSALLVLIHEYEIWGFSVPLCAYVLIRRRAGRSCAYVHFASTQCRRALRSRSSVQSLFGALRKASNARVTIVPMVRPLRLACTRNRRAVVGGSLRVMGTVASVISTGWSSRAASSRYRYA